MRFATHPSLLHSSSRPSPPIPEGRKSALRLRPPSMFHPCAYFNRNLSSRTSTSNCAPRDLLAFAFVSSPFFTLSSRARRFPPTRDLLLVCLRFSPELFRFISRDFCCQIIPRGITLLDKLHFLLASPTFNFLLPPNSCFDVAVQFEMHQAMYAVL